MELLVMGKFPGAGSCLVPSLHTSQLSVAFLSQPSPTPELRNPPLCSSLSAFSSNLSILFTHLPHFLASLPLSCRQQDTYDNSGQEGGQRHIQVRGNSISGQSCLTEAPHPTACPALS